MVMVLMDMMVKTEEVEKMFNGDTLKTLAHGTVGIGVWWLEFIPDFLQYITAILVIVRLIVNIKKEMKK